MVEKVIEFRLFKQNASFSDKQKEDIKKQINNFYNWGKLKGLKQIKIVDISDHSVTVRVTEVDQSWHKKFNYILCHLCRLHEHYGAGLYGQRHLLVVMREVAI